MKKDELPKEIEKKEEIVRTEIGKELTDSFLDYAVSVIVSRALPDVRDGLKPVHRRILWAMWETGLKSGAKYRKSAAVTGEVLKSYHPHGDASVYDAMVRMAQDFSLRYPLIDGQGNWGNIDGDSAAAYRYTECRLSKIAEELLFDIEKETVDWQLNYDATAKEPKVLPAKLPNLLINGSSGIAVGMATSIPPHNLGETVDAAVHLIDNPAASAKDLLKFVAGPDFPTGGVIYDQKAVEEAYVAGRGAVTIRALAEVEEKKSGQFAIIVTEIPYQVNKADLIVRMAELVAAKTVEGVRDIRDESDREGLRIVVELKSDASPQKVLNQLYKHTDLQKDFYLNMLALENGLQPKIMSLKDILAAFLKHREEVIRRRAQFDLKRAEERAHILEGLSKALDHIDEVIAVIKKSADREEAKENLIKKFRLTEIQAVAILEMRLQTLAALERKNIEQELKEKRKLIEELTLLLKNPKKISGVVKEDLLELKKSYADPRRTKTVAAALKEFREEDLVPQEETIITLTRGGYVKRLSPGDFRSQRRGGKGLIGFDVKEEDFLEHFSLADTHDQILFFTGGGRVFQAKAYEIPQAGRTAKGKPIHNFLELKAGENISAVVSYAATAGGYLVMATRNGLIKRTPLADFANVRRSGIAAIALKKGDLLKWVRLSSGEDEIILTTAKGQAIRFKEKDARVMGRAAAGVTAIRLKKDDAVSSLDIIKKDEGGKLKPKFLVVTEAGFGKQTDLGQYKRQRRGGSGIKTAKVTAKTGPIIAAKVVAGEEELLAISAKGQIIRMPLSSVRLAGRATQGVRIMKVKAGDKLSGVICL